MGIADAVFSFKASAVKQLPALTGNAASFFYLYGFYCNISHAVCETEIAYFFS